MDFVNSTAVLGEVQIDLLSDGASYLRWLKLAGLVSPADMGIIRERFTTTELDDVADQAVEVREWLRPIIAEWSTHETAGIPAEIAERLNAMLAHDRRYLQLHQVDGVPGLQEHRNWMEASQLLVPPVAAAAKLLTGGDRQLVRHCQGTACTIWFYDRTKAHRRRWCSMALCGNRAKARNHRQRQAR